MAEVKKTLFNLARTFLMIKIRVSLERLFGFDPVLGTWLSQFYGTRSEVVHEGKSPDLLFQYPGAGQPHRNLLTTGQRLYRAAAEEYMYCHAYPVPTERPPTARFREAFLLDMVPNEVRLEQMATVGSVSYTHLTLPTSDLV